MIRALEPLLGWERFIALHERDDTDHLIYRHPALPDAAERRRLLAAIAPLAAVRHPHLLEVSVYSLDEQDRLCLITPYTGNQEGLVTLADLVERRNGRLETSEVGRCVEQLLLGLQAAHTAGLGGEPIEPERVQVDRRGSLWIELYGLPPADRSTRGVSTIVDEVRAVASMAVWLLTGLRQDIAPERIARIAGRTARPWEPWIEVAIDPMRGFESASEALRALPSRERSEPISVPQVVVPASTPRKFADMLRRFRKVPDGASQRT
jgi:hypothetical protein